MVQDVVAPGFPAGTDLRITGRAAQDWIYRNAAVC
jgi:hypothetical protein